MSNLGGLRVCVPAVVALAGLVACGGGEDEPRTLLDGESTPTTDAPADSRATTAPLTSVPGTSALPTGPLPTEELPGESALALALRLVPADAQEVVFSDVADVKQRLGYADLTGQDPTYERFAFWERARTDGALLTGTRLYDYSSVMSLEFGWTAEDVAWEVAWSTDATECIEPDSCAEGGYVLVLRDDLDWNVVVNSLADNGYTEAPESQHLLVTNNASAPFDAVRPIPEIHGLAVGDVALPSADGDVAPPSAADRLGPLATRLGDPESAYLRPGCIPVETALGPDATDEDVTAYLNRHDLTGLRPPTATAVAIDGRTSARTVNEYFDPAAARADAEPREALINSWQSLQAGESFSAAARADVEPAQSFAVADLAVRDLPLLARMVLTDDAPWALCPAGAR